jgi:DNA-binding transcriptional activator of the SARP family
MKCTNCGSEIEEGQLDCPECEATIQIVPDYNPLEDILAAQVKGAIDEATMRAERKERHKTLQMEKQARERRKKIERQKAQKRRRKLTILAVLGILLALIITSCVVLYLNSYAGLVSKGNRFLKQQEYELAIEPFQRALSKNETKDQAYIGLANAFINLDRLDSAEQMFTSAVEEQPKNIPIYRAFIQFYLDSRQEEQISVLLSECDPAILEELEEYIAEGPEFSLSENEIYDEVQELSLKSNHDIYYTIDDTKPTSSSIRYTEPLLLQEGENVIRAISVNEKGIPSLEVRSVYHIEFPVQDAPAVIPSTGQYEEDMMIEITVPEGYTAYYTTDGSTPTAASTRYSGPIQMPEGETLFSVVLIDGRGRVSNITRRNYILEKNIVNN